MTIHEIIAAVEKASGLPPGVAKDTSNRTDYIKLARYAAFYIARKKTHLGFRKIAQEFGTTDHAIALRAFNRISTGLRAGEPGVVAFMRRLHESGLFGADLLQL
jgi:chromosomal replication initiation ATPase DnaA